MKYDYLLIDIKEWMSDKDRKPYDAVMEVSRFMMEHGYRSFEAEMSQFLEGFLGKAVDQTMLSVTRTGVSLFVNCFVRQSNMVFIDFEPLPIEANDEDNKEEETGPGSFLELDLFMPNIQALQEMREELIDGIMKCLGLTGSKEVLVRRVAKDSVVAGLLKGQLTSSKPISDALFELLSEEKDRAILKELKKRGSILETDLKELPVQGVSPDRMKKTLDYLSGAEYQMVERKYAIVCKDKKEILFTVQSKEDFEKAKNLECPKCSRRIGDEYLVHYYGTTDKMRALLDGNRWMPLLVRSSFLKAGVPEANIYTEVKYAEDEMDLIVFYQEMVFVAELKNRPVTLNDAYKLSAKASRLENALAKLSDEQDYRYVFDLPLDYYATSGQLQRIRETYRRRERIIVPMVISTHDIAVDAIDLLKDTRKTSKFLEYCEARLDEFVGEIIDKINTTRMERRFLQLIGGSFPDSLSALTSHMVIQCFVNRMKINQETIEEVERTDQLRLGW